ncbi:MAG: hypothetical protein Q4D62_12560 [Planctomycetia bacterium]|nr:hypothetical protein [Planctomycetia bacterium]
MTFAWVVTAQAHFVYDANSNYMNAVLSAGQEYETQHFEAVISSIPSSHVTVHPNAPRRICGNKATPPKRSVKNSVHTT